MWIASQIEDKSENRVQFDCHEASWERAASGDECQLSGPTSRSTVEGEASSDSLWTSPPRTTGRVPTAAPKCQLLTVLISCRYLDCLYFLFMIRIFLKFYFLFLLIAVLRKLSPKFSKRLDISQKVGWAGPGILLPSCRGQGRSWGHPVVQRGRPLACQALWTRGKFLRSHSSST